MMGLTVGQASSLPSLLLKACLAFSLSHWVYPWLLESATGGRGLLARKGNRCNGLPLWREFLKEMSSESMEWNGNARGLRFAIVVARFNSAITEKLLEGAHAALMKAGADSESIQVFHVPGAFELPFAARTLAKDFDAIIALGAVIRGETPHFEYVAAAAATGLQQAALDTGVPVAFGVLTTDTVAQAAARAGGEHGNKGYDAAMTAIEMAQFRNGN